MVTLNGSQIWIFAVSIALMGGLIWFVRHTRPGRAMRAISENMRASVADMESIEGRFISPIISSTRFTSGCKRRTTPSFSCSLPLPVNRNPR